jgi:hypothetical protein
LVSLRLSRYTKVPLVHSLTPWSHLGARKGLDGEGRSCFPR